MKLVNCALVALALSGTACGSQSPVAPRMLQVSGTVRHMDGTAVSSAKVSASIGESTVTSTLSDAAGRYSIVVRANGESLTLRASEPSPNRPGETYVGTGFGIVRVEGSPVRRIIEIDIVLDQLDPI